MMLRLLVVNLLAAARAGPPVFLPGGTSPRVWRGEVITLPSAGLSDNEPTTGNGLLAAALNSRGRGGSASSAADNQSLQLFLGSNNMWEFVNVTKNYTSKYYPAATAGWSPTGLGGRVALGGLSIRIGGAAASPPAAQGGAFYAEERVATGQIFGRRDYPSGSFELTVSIERSTSTVLTTCVWRPNATSAAAGSANAAATVDVTTWVTAGRPTNASVAGQHGSIGVLTRGAVRREALAGSPLAIVGALATTLLRGPGARLATAYVHSAANDTEGSEVRMTLQVQAHAPFSLVTTYADSVLSVDPAAAVVSAAAALVAEADSAARLELQSAAYWRGFWGNTSISLPSHPNVEYVWYTANAMGARDSSARSGVAAPGLFGPMITSDKSLWGGDFTLDFDLEKQYFGLAGSNHGELLAAYFASILQFIPSASKAAQGFLRRSKANGTLPIECTPAIAARALHFPCHIAPWGYQSHDRSIYNHWNGELAALIFIQSWEYYRDSVFARQKIYPLLDGLTAFRRCSLTRSAVGNSYRYDILNDSAHEGFIVNNSIIAASFIRRVFRAQIEIGSALNITTPEYLQDVLAHLVALPTARVQLESNLTGLNLSGVQVWVNESPGPASFQGKPWNVSIVPCLPGNKGWQTAVHCWNATGGRLGGLPS